MWNYAALSKCAKEVGGPDKLVNQILSLGMRKGRFQMIPCILGSALGGFGICKLVEFIKLRMHSSETELERAKHELVDGINEYDMKHQFQDDGNG